MLVDEPSLVGTEDLRLGRKLGGGRKDESSLGEDGQDLVCARRACSPVFLSPFFLIWQFGHRHLLISLGIIVDLFAHCQIRK